MKVFRTFASGLIMRRKLIETYIWVCAPIDARADEGDELMTTLVNHEAANWGKIFLFLGFDYFYVLIIEKAPGKGAHHLILFRIRILWIGFGLMMLWKNLLDLLTFFVIDILCLGRSFHCTVLSDIIENLTCWRKIFDIVWWWSTIFFVKLTLALITLLAEAPATK